MPSSATVETSVEAPVDIKSVAQIASSEPSELEQKLQAQLELLEIVQEHAADSENWIRRQAYSLVTDEYRVHHLTAGTLRGDGKLGVLPALFQAKDESQVLSVLHVGTSLCGHRGITHGGLLATILE